MTEIEYIADRLGSIAISLASIAESLEIIAENASPIDDQAEQPTTTYLNGSHADKTA